MTICWMGTLLKKIRQPLLQLTTDQVLQITTTIYDVAAIHDNTDNFNKRKCLKNFPSKLKRSPNIVPPGHNLIN